MWQQEKKTDFAALLHIFFWETKKEKNEEIRGYREQKGKKILSIAGPPDHSNLFVIHRE
jgi:hypothetical protein